MFSRSGALPLSKVGERLQVHPASVTNTIDRLEADGLIERMPHPTDRRAMLASLTPAGRELAGAATEALNDKAFSATGLSDRDQRQLVGLLTKLRRSAGDFGP